MANDISPENARYIADAVKNGIYKDEAQALDEAVGLLRTRDQLRAEILNGSVLARHDDLLQDGRTSY